MRPARAGLAQLLLEGRGWSAVRASCDFVMLLAAVVYALGGVRATLEAPTSALPLLLLPPLALALFHLKGLYRIRMRALILDGLVPLVSGISVATMSAATAGLLLNGSVSDPRGLVRAWVYALLAVALGRTALALAQRRARLLGASGKPVLIVGAGIVGAQVARRLHGHPEYGLIPIGFLDDEPRAVAEVGGRDVPVLGTVEDVEELTRRHRVGNVIVAFSAVADARLARLVQRCHDLGLEVSVVPRMFDTINHRIAYEPLGGLPLLTFDSVHPKGVKFAIKHAFDRLFAACVLLVMLPLLALIALLVKVSSPGQVLYRQRRIGRDGRAFDLYKFRSMRAATEEHGAGTAGAPSEGTGTPGAEAQAQTLGFGFETAPGGVEGVDRRTRVGRLLRRTSLDELPQLVNVLRGEMSVVGPRPERPEFVDVFEQDVVRYVDRHRVKSGITGWAQVNGLRGQTSLVERVELDNYYISHWSLAFDFKIMLLTMLAILHDAE